MSDLLNQLGVSLERTSAHGFDLLEKLIATARPNAAFSHPVTTGDYTVITASEVSCGMGLGFGDAVDHESLPPADGAQPEQANDYNSGGGGGGFSTARPVAAISIGPDGVHVEPIVDVTKIGLALFTTLGAMAVMWNKMQQSGK